MSFVSRARISSERGDTLRAVLTLVAGLRRNPDSPEGVELLTKLVAERIDSGGIEHEIAEALVRQPNRDECLSQMVNGLLEREQTKVADALRAEGEKRGMVYSPPPEPEPEPEPEVEPEADEPEEDPDETAADGSDVRNEDDGDQASPASAGEADGDDESDEPSEPQIVLDEVMTRRKRERLAEREREQKAKKRKRTVVIVTLALVVGFVAVGGYAFQSMQRASDLSEIDVALQAFDRFDTDSLETVRDAAGRRGDAEFAERVQFAEALAGESVAEENQESEWGLAAVSVSAARAADIETSLRNVTKLERLHPDSFPVYVARAYLNEARGDFEGARSAAQNVLDRHAEFLPAHEIIVRTAARQLQFERLEAAVAVLSEHAPTHPYATLGDLPAADEALLRGVTSKKPADDLDSERLDDFVRAAHKYSEAVRLASRGEATAAREVARAAIELDSKFGPAYLIEATAAAAAGDADAAATGFVEAARWADSRELRALVQAAAPTALVGSGRADLAARFTTPFPKLRGEGVDDQFDATVGDSRPEQLRKSAVADAQQLAWAVEALYARFAVIEARGDYAEALAMLRELHGRGIAPSRASILAHRLLRRSPEAGEWADAPDVNDPVVARIDAYFDGRFDESAEPVPSDVPDWAEPILYQLRVASMLPRRRIRSAIEALDRAGLGLAHLPALQGLRLRAYARLGRENSVYTKLYGDLSEPPPNTVPRLLDLAAGAFWQGEVKSAQSWLERAMELAPESREAAWLCGLANRARNRLDQAAECFERSGRDYDESPGLLIELGHVQAQIRNWDEARKMFSKALIAERADLEAARGLGEAYTHLDESIAVRDLERIRANYAEEPPEAAVRGELTKWLAVVRGVRDGNEDARAILDEAASLLGERDDVLMERGRFHASREEWEQARALYQSALTQNATLADAHVAIARIDYRLGDKESAREHLERYLALEPRGRSASWARRQLKIGSQ